MQTEQVLHAERGTLPQEVVDAIAHSSALIVLRENEAGQLVMNATVMEGAFLPETNICHAYVKQVYAEHQNLIAGVHNGITDAMRYRAMREFAALAGTDPTRFEVLNAMLQNFEENNGVADEDRKTAEYVDMVADFMCEALAETARAA